MLASQAHSVAEVARAIDVTQFTCYRWHKKFERNSERLRRTVSDLMPEPAPRKMLHRLPPHLVAQWIVQRDRNHAGMAHCSVDLDLQRGAMRRQIGADMRPGASSIK